MEKGKYIILVLFVILNIVCFTIKTNGQNFHGGTEDGYNANQPLTFNFNNVPEYFYATIDIADLQASPTNSPIVNFKVTFNRNALGFDKNDINISGTANPADIIVTGGPLEFNIAVSGMTDSGTVIINIPPNVCTDEQSEVWNAASKVIQDSIIYDNLNPLPVITLAAGQIDPSKDLIVHFSVIFSKTVTGFDFQDVLVGGTALANNVVVTGVGNLYDIALSGMQSEGSVIITIPQDICTDLAGNLNVSSQNTDNMILFYTNGPFVSINQDIGQADTVNTTPVLFAVDFSENVTGFTFDDIQWSGTAVVNGLVSGSGRFYQVSINSVSGDGSIIGFIPFGKAIDISGNLNKSSRSTDSIVIYDITKPEVTITKDPIQQDPSNSDIISFNANFSEQVKFFTSSDVTLSGSSGANAVYIRGGPTNYILDISGMTTPGSVIIQIPADKVSDNAGNLNNASNNISNIVYFDNIKPEVTISSTVSSPTWLSQIPIQIEFSKEVSGFDISDCNIDNGSIVLLSEVITGKLWNGTIEPISEGIINIQIPADAATDMAGNQNNASNHFQITYLADAGTFEANNIFTPNSSFNRYWIIKNIERYQGYILTIRNASGQIVYENNNYQNNWDGKFNNKYLPTGTYYYLFSSPSKDVNYKGFINIIIE